MGGSTMDHCPVIYPRKDIQEQQRAMVFTDLILHLQNYVGYLLLGDQSFLTHSGRKQPP